MSIMIKRLGVLSLLLVAANCAAQEKPLGIFSQSADVGAVKNIGSCQFDTETQTYRISGSGTNMWLAEDQFQFVWRKLTGDFVLRARVNLVGEGVDPHRKLGWMIRSTLDTDSQYVDLAVHGDGLTSLQFRRSKGDKTEQVESKLTAPDVIQLTRKGGKYTMSVAKYGDPFTSEELEGIELGDEVYVGLFVCSHNADVTETGEFRNVRIVLPAADDFRPYRDYIGSRLETMTIADGYRHVLHEVDDSLQAPNWTRDGKALIYNRNGKLYRFDLTSHQISTIDTGFADQNNNDHVISFDGKNLGISHHTGAGRDSVVYTVPIGGGTPKAITTLDADSYFHSWSPDDQHLIYTAHRENDFDIFKIPSAGGEEVNLTRTPGLDDGSEYTPDGKTIYFNSSRSGRMQIWKMNADGSAQTQVTNDEYNNWFPHIAPDGKSMVILSFDATVAPDDHPFYKHVYLRHMAIDPANKEASTPRVIAYLYGGQGTINVPSWSPDGSQIAFVSNSRVLK